MAMVDLVCAETLARAWNADVVNVSPALVDVDVRLTKSGFLKVGPKDASTFIMHFCNKSLSWSMMSCCVCGLFRFVRGVGQLPLAEDLARNAAVLQAVLRAFPDRVPGGRILAEACKRLGQLRGWEVDQAWRLQQSFVVRGCVAKLRPDSDKAHLSLNVAKHHDVPAALIATCVWAQSLVAARPAGSLHGARSGVGQAPSNR